MNEQNNNQKNETTVDEEILAMRKSFTKGRLTLDFEGMDTMSIKRRADYIRLTLHATRERMPENKGRPSNEVAVEADREDFYPNVQALCDNMVASANARYDRAARAYTEASEAYKPKFDKKQAATRRAVDEKFEKSIKKMLDEERKKIDAQKKEMEKYLKLAPDSSYVVAIKEILKSNEECFEIASQCLVAQSATEKYEFYQKRGVATEEDKKLSELAVEMEEAARLKLTNAKEKAFLTLESEAYMRFDDKELSMQAHTQYKNCDKGTFAFLEVPKGLTEKALQYGLWQTENKYYEKLAEKNNLTGFHPFKKMALNYEIKKIADAYYKGRALIGNGADIKQKYPDLVSGEQKQKSNGIVEEKIVEDPVEEVVEQKQPKQLDLTDQIHTKKEIQQEIIQEEMFIEEKIIEEPDMEL